MCFLTCRAGDQFSVTVMTTKLSDARTVAANGLKNSARNPSPVVLISLP